MAETQLESGGVGRDELNFLRAGPVLFIQGDVVQSAPLLFSELLQVMNLFYLTGQEAELAVGLTDVTLCDEVCFVFQVLRSRRPSSSEPSSRSSKAETSSPSKNTELSTVPLVIPGVP